MSISNAERPVDGQEVVAKKPEDVRKGFCEETQEEAQYETAVSDILTGRKTIEPDAMQWLYYSGKKLAVNDSCLEEHIIRTFPCFRTASVLHWYQSGIYIPDVEGTVSKTLIRLHLPESLQKIYIINNVYNLLMSDERISVKAEQLNRYSAKSILFKNGIYDPLTNTVKNHSPRFLALGGLIPHEYNPEEVIPEEWGTDFEKYASEAFENDEDKLSFLEFIGNACCRYCGFEKNLWLQGTGSSGKSVAIKIVLHIVGKGNYSALSLQQMTEKFFKIQLLGKLLNACTDLNSKSVDYSGDFKKIVSGEEITDSYKNKQNFSFEPYAKHIFSANELPQVNDRSTGFYRRLIIISMNHVPEKPDPDLIKKLTSERSTAYILDKAVKAYAEALKRGKMTVSEDAVQNVEEYRKSNDSITAFWEDKIKVTGDDKDTISRDVFFNEYVNFCKEEEYKPVKKKNLFKVLREQRGLKDKKSGNERSFSRIKWKDESQVPSAQNAPEKKGTSGNASALNDNASALKRAESALNDEDFYPLSPEDDVPFP